MAGQPGRFFLVASAVTVLLGTVNAALPAPNGTTFLREDFSSFSIAGNWLAFTGSGSGAAYVAYDATQVPQKALRLTTATNGQFAGVEYGVPLPTAAGLDVTIAFAMWGGTGADGMSVYLRRGSVTPTAIGSRAAALGYSCWRSTGGAGLPGGLVGVGLDLWGSNAFPSVGGSDCAEAGQSDVSYPNSIVIRGPGIGSSSLGYCRLANPVTSGISYNSGASSRAGRARSVRVVVDPSTKSNPRLKVFYGTDSTGTNLVQKVDVALPAAFSQESTFTFGFAGSTGGSNNNHEVLEIAVGSLVTLPDVDFFPAQTALRDHIRVPGSTYSATVLVLNAVAPANVTISSGALPAGISSNITTVGGNISIALTGYATGAAGLYTFTFNAVDSRSPSSTASQTYTINVIDPPVAIAPPSGTTLAAGAIAFNTPVAAAINATNGIGNVTFAVTAGTLPPGLSATTTALGGGKFKWALAGTPTVPGVYSFTVSASDTRLPSASVASGTYVIEVVAPPVLQLSPTSGALPAVLINATSYSGSVLCTGFLGAVTISVTGGTLPPGLTPAVAVSGSTAVWSLNGSPNTVGSFDFQLTATDSRLPSPAVTVANLTIPINAPPGGIPAIGLAVTLLGGDLDALRAGSATLLRAGFANLTGIAGASVLVTSAQVDSVTAPATTFSAIGSSALNTTSTLANSTRVPGQQTTIFTNDPLNAAPVTAARRLLISGASAGRRLAACVPVSLSGSAPVTVPVSTLQLAITLPMTYYYAMGAVTPAQQAALLAQVQTTFLSQLSSPGSAGTALGDFVSAFSACTGMPASLGVIGSLATLNVIFVSPVASSSAPATGAAETAAWIAFAFLGTATIVIAVLSYLRNLAPEGRLTYRLLAVLNGETALAYLVLALGSGVGVAGSTGNSYSWVLYAAWAIAGPLTVVLLGLLAGAHWIELLWASAAAVIGVAAGFAGVQSSGPNAAWPLLTFALVAGLLPLSLSLLCGFRRSASARHSEIGRMYTTLAVASGLLYAGYAVVWGVTQGSASASFDDGIIAFAVFDILTKVIFAAVLIAGREAIARYGSWLGWVNTGVPLDFPIVMPGAPAPAVKRE